MAHLSPAPQAVIRGQPSLALSEEGSFTTESEPSGALLPALVTVSSRAAAALDSSNAQPPQRGPCPESRDSLRNLTTSLCLDCDLRKACNMVRLGLICTGAANTLLTFQDEARIYILSLNLFLGKEKTQQSEIGYLPKYTACRKICLE